MNFLLLAYIFIFGTVVGSFLNVCIIRYQNKEPIATGRSHCMTCHHQLAWYDMFPVFSWIFLKGKCRYCGAKISARYPIVEALTGALFVLAAVQTGIKWELLIYFLFVSTCIYAGFVDLDSMIIPDRTHFILIACGLLLLWLNPGSLNDRLIGAVCISVPLLIIAVITKGMGIGDVKLMASAGFVLGWKPIILAMVIGSVLGSVFGLIQMKKKELTGKSEMPLGPWLSVGCVFALLYGQPLIDWYLTSFFH
jgi:leader peptidase (prepilin peptidase)/N-methyltransferase